MPVIKSWWKHRNGNNYQVIMIANAFTDNEEKYPVTIIYKGLNGRVWSRPLSDWHRSMSAN